MKKLLFFVFIILIACSEEYDVPNHVPGIVKIFNNRAFVTYGEGGLIITDVDTEQVLAHIFPPRETNSIDDFDVDGEMLFILDARNKNYLTVFSISDINNPELLDGPVLVGGGPFNGVSAKGGNVVVSGGTFLLEYFQYSNGGELRGPATFGRDRGHPDILLSDNGQIAYASTDFEILPDEPRFGVLALYLGDQLSIPGVLSEYKIEGVGFTQGGTQPVGFPLQLKIHKNHLLAAHGGGLTIIELIENSALGTAHSFDFGIEATAIETQNDTAFIIGYQGEIPVFMRINISDLNNPTIMETEVLNIGNSIPTSIAVNSQFVYITAGNAGLLRLPNN